MTYKKFIERILEDENHLTKDDLWYIRKHARRFFNTYNFCLNKIPQNAKILSIGGYFGSIEKMLKEAINAEITIIDFPDSVEINKKYYDFLGFKYVGIDLSQGLSGIDENYFDLIIYTEVIEHIPLSPYEQLLPFDKFLKSEGKVLITTPNLSSIVHIAKLFMKLPLFDTPEKFFSPVSQENLQVHRREYMPAEIVEAFKRMEYSSEVGYFIYNEPKSLAYRMMYIIGNLIPRFKEGMMILGKKP